MILSGVNVWQGAIIVTGSIVTKDVPPYNIFKENPVKIIEYRFEPEVIDKLVSYDFAIISKGVIIGNEKTLCTKITKDNIDIIIIKLQR